MRLPQYVVLAVNTYFAHKRYGVDGVKGTGQSFESGEKKQACLALLDHACTKHDIGLCVVPGVIHLARGKQKAQFNGPILPKAGR
jgi:hypothetical protein